MANCGPNLRLIRKDDQFGFETQSRDEVLARFGPVLAPKNLDSLSAEDFKSFLQYKNNRHWTGLNRLGWKACENMDSLQRALHALLDESQPVANRLDHALAAVPGMGRALATAILLVVYPDRYGVWNGTSEAGMKTLGVWPTVERGTSAGRRYEAMNALLLRFANDLNIDLWTLDVLWWALVTEPLGGNTESERLVEMDDLGASHPSVSQRFPLEAHLQEFLFDNWAQTELATDWSIYSEDGDETAGYEYPTAIGRVDLLARHREPCWLVIELKRGQTSDATVGQVARYMGWVMENLAGSGEMVQGLVIAHQIDDAMRFALKAVRDVHVLLYEVDFKLRHLDAE